MISKVYTTNGVKAAMLTVTTGSTRIVAPCTNGVRVGPRTIGTTVAIASSQVTGSATDIQGTCAPSITKSTTNKEIIWSAAVIGGTGSYQYLWK